MTLETRALGASMALFGLLFALRPRTMANLAAGAGRGRLWNDLGPIRAWFLRGFGVVFVGVWGWVALIGRSPI